MLLNELKFVSRSRVTGLTLDLSEALLDPLVVEFVALLCATRNHGTFAVVSA